MATDKNIAEYQEQIEAAREVERQLFAPDFGEDKIDSTFIRSCLYNNERGDGLLFAKLQRGRFVMVKNWGKSGTWLQWAGHHWIIDKLDAARNAVEDVAKLYLDESLALQVQEQEAEAGGDQKKAKKIAAERNLYLKRVFRLRTLGGAKACLEWSTTIGEQSLSIISDQIDLHPWLLACNNGVVDLRTAKFSHGRPDDYLLRAVPIDWVGLDATCPKWDRFIDEIHLGNKPLIAFLDRLFGCCLTGVTKNHFVGVFLGEGRNGKGTMFETLRAMLGDLGWSISPELLLEQKNTRSSAGPSPDLISLQGRRLLVASESDENRRISQTQWKRLSGGDTINARAPHDREDTNFRPTWKIFFYTNNIPRGLAKDHALKSRLVYIDYLLKFEEHPDPSDPYQRKMDPDLPEDLLGELPGILARYVRGCIQWQEMGGLYPPDQIRQAADDLQRREDPFRQFFDEMVETIQDPKDQGRFDEDIKTAFKEIYGAFEAWYEDEVGGQDRYRPTKKSVSQWLDKRGFRRSKPSGIAHFHGLKLKLSCDI